jgi:hypothetical protein
LDNAVLPHTYRDVPALGRVAHGVVQEYGGGLEDAVPIEGGLDLSFREDAFDRHLSVAGVPGCLRRLPKCLEEDSRKFATKEG